MIDLLAVAAGAAALGGGGWVYSLVKRGRAHARWKLVLDDVAQKIGGRASLGSMFDAPELRAELDGITVTLRLHDIHKRPELGIAKAESKLPRGEPRLYFGWDVREAPVDLAHVKEVPASPAIEGRVIAKADDAELAARFMERGLIDLIDVRREASAHALEVICRGGYLTLVLHGIQEAASLLERMVIVSTRLAKLIGGDRPPVALDLTCALCDEKHDGKPWLRCRRCSAPYHRACFEQAGACLVNGCGETQSRPLEDAR